MAYRSINKYTAFYVCILVEMYIIGCMNLNAFHGIYIKFKQMGWSLMHA